MENIGTIRISESLEILFYIDSFRGKQYANIRKFVRSKKYTGPTKSGVKLNKSELQVILGSLKNIPNGIHDLEECILCEIPIYSGKFIRVSISYFNGAFGIDVREYFDTAKYKGPGKAGVRISYIYLDEIRNYLQFMIDKLTDWPEDTLFHVNKIKSQQSQENLEIDSIETEGVPDEYKKFF